MSLTSMNTLFTIFILLTGFYCLYAWYQLRGGAIPERFVLLPKDFDPQKCLDQDRYVTYLRPRLLVFSLLTVFFGGFTLADEKLSLLDLWFPNQAFVLRLLLSSILPLAVVVWFCVCLSKIQKELW